MRGNSNTAFSTFSTKGTPLRNLVFYLLTEQLAKSTELRLKRQGVFRPHCSPVVLVLKERVRWGEKVRGEITAKLYRLGQEIALDDEVWSLQMINSKCC